MKKCIKIIFILIISFVFTNSEAANYYYTTIGDLGSGEDNKYVGGFTDMDSCKKALEKVHSSWKPSSTCYLAKEMSITKITPLSAKINDYIEITGNNFNNINVILFGSVPAKYFDQKESSIKVQVPQGSLSGKITIKSTVSGQTTSKDIITIDSSNMFWWYTNGQKQLMGSGGLHNLTGFDTKEDCDKKRLDYINSLNAITVTVGECFQNTKEHAEGLIETEKKVGQEFIQTLNKKEGEKSNTFVKEKYTLLAPIGDFTEFDGNDIGDYLNLLVKLAIGLCGALAVIMLIVNGVSYMGEGSIFKKAQAKDNMQNAILGLLIALGSWAILNTINPDLLGGRGLSIRVAKLDVDMETHGDEPQEGPVNGKYCAGRIDANSETAPNGRKWAEDGKERTELENVGIRTQRTNSCKTSGEKNCTSLTGLDTSKVIDFKISKCPSCEVVINGGTECWLHSAETTHFPGNPIVDFDDTSSMTKYVESGKNLGKTTKGNYSIYEKDGIQFLDEGNHYHIIKW